MPGDVVILLSSDDSDDSDAFVTPHPRTAADVDVDVDDDDGDDDGFPTGPRAQPRAPATATIITSQTKTHTRLSRGAAWESDSLLQKTPANKRPTATAEVAVIAIDDTPAPATTARNSHGHEGPPARSGFLGFSSDDMSSSPFPGPGLTRSQPPKDQSEATKSVPKEPAQLANITNTLLSRPFSDSFDDDDYNSGPRPAKRQRLSPCDENRAGPQTKSNNTENSLPRQLDLAPHHFPSPKRQKTTIFSVDDFDDDLDDLSNHVPVQPTRQMQKKSPPKLHAECIDLLSSSESEAGDIRTTKTAPAAAADFADVDNILMRSSPPPRRQEGQPPQTKQMPATATRHRREPSDDVMLLSSSSFEQSARRPSNMHRQKGSTAGASSTYRPPKPQRRQGLQRSRSEGQPLTFDDDDDDDDDDSFMDNIRGLSGVDDLLAAWREDPAPGTQNRHGSSSGRREGKSSASARRRSSYDGTPSGTGNARTKARPRATDSVEDEDDKETRRREKEAAREEKRKEKEAEKEKKQKDKELEKERRKIASEIAKEKKAQERAEAAAFTNANRSRLDKSVAAPEMIVRLPVTLPQATREVAETMLAEIKSSHETWTAPLDNVVTWRRKVTAEYKPDLGHWVPVELRTDDEKHAMAIFRGDDFVQLILARQDPDIKRQTGGYDLDGHVQAMKRFFPRHSIIYLIEGLNAWKNKNRTIRNRQFVAAVRNAGGGNGGATSAAAAAAAAALARSQQAEEQPPPPNRPSNRLGRRGQQQPPQHLDEAVVDEALLELQVEHAMGDDEGDAKVLVHETHSSLDTARWIKIFTEQIATVPYRQQKEEMYASAASFCMDSGQIATGDGPAEMYTLMLQQIARVTEPVAMGVAARYDTLPKLLRGFREEGPLALEACLKSRNRNGSLSDRAVGQALSRRIYKVFMGRDEASTDV